MSTRGRPINADVPVAEPDRVRPSPGGEDAPAKPAAAPSGPPPPQPPRPKRARRPIPGALKAIAGLVLVAIVFIVAAILGGGSDDGSSIPGRGADAGAAE